MVLEVVVELVTSYQHKVPERFECAPLPAEAHIEDWFENHVLQFRLVTGGFAHAEEYIRKAWKAATRCRRLSQAEKEKTFEELACDEPLYLHPEEKMLVAMVGRLSGAGKRRWSLKLQQRRADGLHPPQGRQMLFWMLLQWMQSSDQDGEAFSALLALRSSCEKEAITIDSLSSFRDLFELALMKGSADQIPETQRLTFLQDCLENSQDPDIKAEMRFHFDADKSERSVDSLLDRLDKILTRKRDHQLRNKHSKSIQQLMTPKGNRADRANVQREADSASLAGEPLTRENLSAFLKEELARSGLVGQL